MARSKTLHDALRPDTLAGAIKLRCEERGITLAQLAPFAGLRPDSLRARLCKSRGKRALQPWQVSNIAQRLGVPAEHLHQLAAQHEGWQITRPTADARQETQG